MRPFIQSDTVNDLILLGGHFDLYIMAQRFSIVSLTISNRKTLYRSVKQTAGSTSRPWTTILVISSDTRFSKYGISFKYGIWG